MTKPVPDEAHKVRVCDRGVNQQIPSRTVEKKPHQSPNVRVQSLSKCQKQLRAWQTGGVHVGMENALRAKPMDIREQYERQLKELQEAYGEAMLELRVRDKLSSLLGEDEK